MNKLQSIISIKPEEFISNHHLSYQQVKVINNIISCQTSNMGSHKLSCDCGHEKIVHNSCHNRHCPICGNFKKEMWVQKQQESVIPSHYFHLVFTLPSELRALVYFNQKSLYDLMYKATSKTLLDLSKSQFGVIPGFSLILHTWSQTLMFHPHLHCILAGGGLSLDQSHFKSFKKKYFLPVKMLSRVYKAKFLEKLKYLYDNDKLMLPNDLQVLEQPKIFQTFVDELFKKDWVVFSKRVFKSAQHVIRYLGRYTHKIAIYADRINKFDEDSVTFDYHDRSDNNHKKEMTLSRDEFVRRFLDHVLPYRFTKIRHYGFLTNRFRHSKTALIRRLIAKQRGVVMPIIKALDKETLLLKLIGKERMCCPKCGGLYHYSHDVCKT
jgi:hypothetical protein